MMVNNNLVGGVPTPLKNMSSSVGMMTFPTEWKNESHVPNHQPVMKKGLDMIQTRYENDDFWILWEYQPVTR